METAEVISEDSQATHTAQEEAWEQRQEAAVWAVQEQLQASATACTEAEAKAATAVAKAAESGALFRACEDALRQTTELAAKASERGGDGSDDTAADASVEAALADWKLGAQEAAREVGAAAQQDAARQAAELAGLREVAVEHENAVSAGVARVCELETELQAVTAASTVAEARCVYR